MMRACILRRRAMKQYKVSKKRARYRECVIKELIKTESDYTRDLNIVIERVPSFLIVGHETYC
jgi:hypothetical protein